MSPFKLLSDWNIDIGDEYLMGYNNPQKYIASVVGDDGHSPGLNIVKSFNGGILKFDSLDGIDIDSFFEEYDLDGDRVIKIWSIIHDDVILTDSWRMWKENPAFDEGYLYIGGIGNPLNSVLCLRHNCENRGPICEL